MGILWGVVGFILWFGQSFTLNEQWQKPMLYCFVLVQICLEATVFLIKSLRAGEQPSEFADFKDSKTRDISPTMPDSV